jgi:hypothetical protein
MQPTRGEEIKTRKRCIVADDEVPSSRRWRWMNLMAVVAGCRQCLWVACWR